MNILVIGNGFDIAHGLPTGYKDFLRFTDAFMEFKKERRVLGKQVSVKEDEKEKQLIKYLVDLFNKAEADKATKKLVNEIEELIIDNKWLEYFKTINIAQGWIDFEREISKVVHAFDKARIETLSELRSGGKGARLAPYQIDVLKPFIGKATLICSMDSFGVWKDKLLKDLNRLTRCLEIYLCDYVENLPIKQKLPDIDGLDIDGVVSFNYTNTYRKNYVTDSAKKVACDFIHGEAKIENNIETCNMVIGIDEYLIGKAREEDNEYIQFKKFFQRIYKGTGSDYVDWLKNPKGYTIDDGKSYPTINIFIYGHSLDSTDGDILSTLIMTEHAKTTIFYHDKEALEKQIINLTKVITEEELIRKTGGIHKSIKFQPTKK